MKNLTERKFYFEKAIRYLDDKKPVLKPVGFKNYTVLNPRQTILEATKIVLKRESIPSSVTEASIITPPFKFIAFEAEHGCLFENKESKEFIYCVVNVEVMPEKNYLLLYGSFDGKEKIIVSDKYFRITQPLLRSCKDKFFFKKENKILMQDENASDLIPHGRWEQSEERPFRNRLGVPDLDLNGYTWKWD